MKQVFRLIMAILVAVLFSAPSYALDGKEVMKKVLNVVYYQGKDQRAHAHMKIIDKQGRERIRDLILLRRNMDSKNGEQKYYVYFTRPSDIRKMVFMAWKNTVLDDDRWLYLPALDLVKRIAASDERTSFVGSHFFYEDVSGRGLDEDSHQLIKDDELYYTLRSRPVSPSVVEFSSYQMVVDKKTFLPKKIEYYQNDNADAYRVYETLASDDIDGYPTVTKSRMEDMRTGGSTIIEYSEIKYAQGIPEKIFSERYLRKAPRRYLK